MATTVTPAGVQAFAPQFAAVSTSVIQTWIDWAVTHVSEDTFATRFNQAVMLWVCHQLQCTQGAAAGAAGAVTGMDAGDVSVTFAAGVDSTGFRRTGFGQQFLAVQRLVVGGPRAV